MRKIISVVAMLSLLLGGIALWPSTAHAAPWLSAGDTYAAGWVKDIEQELNKADYRAVFLNDPRTPQTSVLRFLNRAAVAAEAGNSGLAAELKQQAIGVLEEGVHKRYYDETDIAPIINYINQHVP